MKKIKVLGIAPFESMSTLMLQAGAKRNDISLTVYTGDLEDGAAIASRYTQNDFDFIISRGGTAQLIRQVSSIPVIEITISLTICSGASSWRRARRTIMPLSVSRTSLKIPILSIPF